MAKLELKLKIGDPAPDFTAPTQDDHSVTLSSFRGKWVILFFYPRDNTPGCTLEACGFRDRWEALTERGAVVLGVSTDSVRSHVGFAQRFKLPFPLLADPDKKLVSAYGVYAAKSFMGRIGLGTHRVSFLIDPTGRIAEIWTRVSPTGHPAEVEAAIDRLTKA